MILGVLDGVEEIVFIESVRFFCNYLKLFNGNNLSRMDFIFF